MRNPIEPGAAAGWLPGVVAVILLCSSPAVASTPERIDAFVRAVMQSTRIPGVAVVVVEQGHTVFAGGWGEDGRGGRITADTPFWIGSNTKSFTALAVMQLVEEGRLVLDQPVARYLPDFRLATPGAAQRITVRQLLEQTSGLPRRAGLQPVIERTTADGPELLNQLLRVRPVHEPGTVFEYCNWNYVLLGQLIEAVTGAPWADHVQRRILAPLGMRRSFTHFAAARAAGMSLNHRYLFGFPMAVENTYLPGLAATGYLVASARDMGRYLAMFQSSGLTASGERILSAGGVDELLRPASPPAANRLMGHRFAFRYGKGWFAGPFGGAEEARWHLGQLDSFHAWMALDTRHDRAIAVLANANSFVPLAAADLGRLGPGVMRTILGQAIAATPSLASVYAVLSTASLLIVALLLWLTFRLPVRKPGYGTAGAAIAAAATVGAGWPALNGMTWPVALRTLPDLSAVLMIVGCLFLALAIAALWRRA